GNQALMNRVIAAVFDAQQPLVKVCEPAHVVCQEPRFAALPKLPPKTGGLPIDSRARERYTLYDYLVMQSSREGGLRFGRQIRSPVQEGRAGDDPAASDRAGGDVWLCAPGRAQPGRRAGAG